VLQWVLKSDIQLQSHHRHHHRHHHHQTVLPSVHQ
jgi:hypothetical protein